MAARDWNTLNWGAGATLIPSGRAMVDPSSEPDAMRNARANFDTTANAALLASLSNNAADPLSYLASQGYTVGVGHEPGSKPQGRAEYWGLLDPKGQFVQGQSDPTMTTSDSWFDLIAPFALLAPAALGVVGAAGAGVGAGAGSAAGAGGAAGTLGATYIPTAVESLAALAPLEGGLSAAAAALPEIATIGGSLGGVGAGLGTLGSAYVPTAVAPVTAAPLTGGLSAGASALPEFSTIGGSLGAAGGTGGGSAVKGALYGDAGYGAGMSGAQTGTYDAVLNATGSKGLANAAANLPGLSNATNLLNTGSNLASAVGGLLGAVDAGKGTTATSQNQIDPRMAQYLYGTGYGDTNSLLGAAQQQFNQNRSGLNALQQQALDMQKNFLMSPEYTQGFNQIRSAGSGLLGQQVAANPFTTGQAGLLMQMPQQPTSQMAGFNPGSIQQLIAAGRGLLG